MVQSTLEKFVFKSVTSGVKYTLSGNYVFHCNTLYNLRLDKHKKMHAF